MERWWVCITSLCLLNLLLVYMDFWQTVLSCWAMWHIAGKYLENVHDQSEIYRSSLTNSNTQHTVHENLFTAFLSRDTMPCCAMQVAQYIFHPDQVKFNFLLCKYLKIFLEDEASITWRALQKLIKLMKSGTVGSCVIHHSHISV